MPSPQGSTQGYWLIDPCNPDVQFLGGFTMAVFAGPWHYDGVTWVPTSPTGPAPSTPTSTEVQQALARAPWPRMQIGTNPPPDRLAVNFPVWLSLSGWRSVSVTAALGAVRATVSARPVSARWVMGDGGSVTCAGPGRPYDSRLSWQQNLARRSCGYTYRTSSASAPRGEFVVTVTVTYAVTLTVAGAPAGGSLGTYDRQVSLPVTVGQIESLDN